MIGNGRAIGGRFHLTAFRSPLQSWGCDFQNWGWLSPPLLRIVKELLGFLNSPLDPESSDLIWYHGDTKLWNIQTVIRLVRGVSLMFNRGVESLTGRLYALSTQTLKSTPGERMSLRMEYPYRRNDVTP
jgi:hypothetical protein